MEIAKIKKAYLIGIKGAGMTALAQVLQSRGIKVSGSDVQEKFFTDEVLRKNKIKHFESFRAENIPSDADIVIHSTAYNEKNNVELITARKRKIKIVNYAEALGMLFDEKIGIAVCGTHGKTTTTAMLAEILRFSGAEPAAIAGSKVKQWGGGALDGPGRYFVAEADEYQNKFKFYKPFAVVLTSVDWDHPDYFKTFKEYKQAFSDFINRIPKHGFLVAWGDSVSVLDVIKKAKCGIIKYGFLKDNDVMLYNHRFSDCFQDKQGHSKNPNSNFQKFAIKFSKKNLGEFQIQLVGKHNVLNAAAAIAVCYKLGTDIEKVRQALKNFSGTARRFDYVGQRNGAILIDDYAHHPEEIKATLKAAREIYPNNNIITIFHPHTFTRTKVFLSEFSQSFNDANKVIVINIYGSARETRGGVTSEELVNSINIYDYGKAEHIPTIDKTIKYLKNKIGKGDVVISMGAGDVWKVTEALSKK